MTLIIEIPGSIESALRCQFGPGLELRAKQDLAVAWFSEGRITARQAAELLGVSLFEAHAFLKQKGASLPMSVADVEADLSSLRESRGS